MTALAVEPLARPAELESADGFAALTTPHRRELLVHCYRMLGSIDDAEDAVQEAFARAWRGRATYRRDVSLRAWLYRIATNACLDAIARRKATSGAASGATLTVLPAPDDLIAEADAGPEARYDAHESISLAFLTALQLLTPRQRGVLILRDVLGWRAAEAAELLEVSLPAANSALHRARGVLGRSYAPGRGRGAGVAAAGPRRGPAAPEPDWLRSLLERYVRAWESADIPGLIALLREDAVVSMPPGVTVVGRAAIAEFLANSVFAGRQIRLRPIRANGGPAFVLYSGAAAAQVLSRYSVLVLDVEADPDLERSSVTRMTVYTEPKVVARFEARTSFGPRPRPPATGGAPTRSRSRRARRTA